MVPVGGRPFLEYVIRQLANQGFQEVVLLVGYRAESIESYFGDGSVFGLKIGYSQEPESLGTGGAIKLAKSLIPNRFLLLYGDLYRDVDYAGFCATHGGNALAVYPYVDGLTTISCANVGLDAGSGKVIQYKKNDPSAGFTHVDAGFGVFTPETLDLLPDGVSSFEEEIYPRLSLVGTLEAHLVGRDFFDIGNPADLAHAREFFVGRFSL